MGSRPSQATQYLTPDQVPMIQVGMELGVFALLSSRNDQAWSIKSLAAILRCDDDLLYRLLRYFFSIGLLRENPNMTYAATDNTRWLATEGAEARLRMYRQHSASPSSLATASDPYSQPPLQQANAARSRAPRDTNIAGEGLSPEDPNRAARFVQLMRVRRDERPDWTSLLPASRIQLSGEDVYRQRHLFVDVGGALGAQCIHFRIRYPQLSGQIVLQDQGIVLALADAQELQRHGVTAMTHNLLDVQPVLGAKVYYLRHVLHEWPDDECVAILQRLRLAMANDSIILVDDMILPEKGAVLTVQQSWISSTMAALTKMERNETQWRDVVQRAGLSVENIYRYDQELGEGLLLLTKTTLSDLYRRV